MENKLVHSEQTGLILKAFYKVYNILGYGFLEKVYQNALLFELHSLGVNCTSELPVKVYYDDHLVGDYYADILVDEKVIVELKAVENIAPEHEAQLVNYLKGTGLEVGMLLNFGPKPQYVRRVLTRDYLERIGYSNPGLGESVS
jgi:GxxExxY protein